MGNLRSVLILGVVALGLLAYIFFYESSMPSTDALRETAGQLYDIDQKDITQVTITNPKGKIVLERGPERWRIIEPVSAPVSTGTMTQILNWLEFGASSRDIDYELIHEDGIHTLRRFGLVPPEIRVDFQGPKIGGQVLLVGRQVANTPSAYAKTTDEKEATIRIVPQELRDLLSLGLNELRGRQVFDVNPALIATTSVGLPSGGAVEVQRIADRAWQMQKPIVSRADNQEVLAWIGRVMRLRVADYVSDESANLTTYGLASPMARVTLNHGPRGEAATLLLGNAVPDKEGQLYAKLLDNPTVFTVDREEALGLVRSLSNTRDRRLAPLDVERITGVELAQADGPDFAVEATAEGWDIKEQGQANSTAVFDLLNMIAEAKIHRFVKDAAADLAPYGLDDPRVIIKLVAAPASEGRPPTELVVRIGKTEKGETYVSTSEGPSIVTVPSRLLEFIPRQAIEWRGLRVADTHLENVKEVRIATDKEVEAALIRQPNGTYTTSLPHHEVDAVTVDQQAALLTRLRGLRWLGLPKPEYGLESPVLRYELLLDDGSKVVLNVGRELPTIGRAAQIEGDDMVFELAPEDYRTLSAFPLVKSHKEGPSTPAPAIPEL